MLQSLSLGLCLLANKEQLEAQGDCPYLPAANSLVLTQLMQGVWSHLSQIKPSDHPNLA
jgi:hypothetical protein